LFDVVGTAGDDEDACVLGIMGVADDLREKSPFPDDISTHAFFPSTIMFDKLRRVVTQSPFPFLETGDSWLSVTCLMWE